MFEDIRSKFPVYDKNPSLVFLDTAASALKPIDMINEIQNCYSFEYANVHRGLYTLSANLTKKFEDARFKVSNFISAKSFEIVKILSKSSLPILITSSILKLNAEDAINLVSDSSVIFNINCSILIVNLTNDI